MSLGRVVFEKIVTIFDNYNQKTNLYCDRIEQIMVIYYRFFYFQLYLPYKKKRKTFFNIPHSRKLNIYLFKKIKVQNFCN